jgi:Uma2 family endonuclease
MSTVAKLRLGPADQGRRMSIDEFLEADEEPGNRCELARGVLEVTEVLDDPHGQVEWNILRALARYDEAHPGLIARVGGSGSFRLWLPGMISGRNPDVAVALRGASKDARGRRVASLAVEIVSPGGETRDYVIKREEYLVYGLREYWIVDLAARRVTVLTRDGDIWLERVHRDDEPIASLVLPGLALPVRDFWVDVNDDEAAGG